MLIGDIICVSMQKIGSLRVFLDFTQIDLILTFLNSNDTYKALGQKIILYDASQFHMSMYAKKCVNRSYG